MSSSSLELVVDGDNIFVNSCEEFFVVIGEWIDICGQCGLETAAKTVP